MSEQETQDLPKVARRNVGVSDEVWDATKKLAIDNQMDLSECVESILAAKAREAGYLA